MGVKTPATRNRKRHGAALSPKHVKTHQQKTEAEAPVDPSNMAETEPHPFPQNLGLHIGHYH